MIELNQGDCLVDSSNDGSKKYDATLKRVDFCGNRCYKRSEDKYYPSVTTILSAAPVDSFFLDWIKLSGKNADWARDKAAREGTAVHEALEDVVAGKTVDWKDSYGNAKYSLTVWQMILKGVDFFNTYKPEILASEQFLFSDRYEYAGTADFLCRLNNKITLIDYKTSNTISETYRMQLAAYAKAYEEIYGIKIDNTAILWFKASTRGPRKGAIQGEGWQLIEYPDIDKNFEAFLKIYDVYKIYNPGGPKPYTKSYPTEVKLDY